MKKAFFRTSLFLLAIVLLLLLFLIVVVVPSDWVFTLLGWIALALIATSLILFFLGWNK